MEEVVGDPDMVTNFSTTCRRPVFQFGVIWRECFRGMEEVVGAIPIRSTIL
jgi:hypothetical protein